MHQGALSLCDVMVDSSLFVAEETSLGLVGGSSIIVVSGSSHVAAKDSLGLL